jgi:ketosteroid isomerase-like protein
MNPQTFNDAVEAGRMALGSMAKGDAGPSTALWSRRDDVVLANPLGPPIVGFPSVAAETARVASMFVGGEQPVFDEVVRWSSDDLGNVLAIEHAVVQRAGGDELVTMDLRVTTIFRREDVGWRVCVRHADRITSHGRPNTGNGRADVGRKEHRELIGGPSHAGSQSLPDLTGRR